LLEIKKSIKKLFTIFFTLFLFVSCEDFNFSDVNFGGDIYSELENDLSVIYTFYENENQTSNHISKKYITGKTVYKEAFPKYEQENYLLVGWHYMPKEENNDDTTNPVPSNFVLSNNQYVNSFRVGNVSESLYGIWKKKCTVTFVTNQPGITIDPVILPEGDKVSQPQMTYRIGNYRMWGWYTDPEFTENYNFSQPVVSDLTLYARWEEVFVIKYHKNDGTDNWIEREYSVAATYTQTYEDNIFGKYEGHGFVGWSSSADGNVEYYSGQEISGTENIDLYAVWSTDLVTVNYVDKSGTYTSRSEVYGRGAHINISRVYETNNNWTRYLREIWKKEGIEIKGFSESADDDVDNLPYDAWGQYYLYDEEGNHITNENGSWAYQNYIEITEDKSFYVYWKDIIFNVYFYYTNENGRDVLFDSQTVAWNQCAERPESSPLLYGKTFDNWYRRYWRNNERIVSETPFDFTTVFNDDNLEGYRGIELVAKFTDGGPTEGSVETSISFEESYSDISVNETISGTTITFTAPSGYDSYTWRLNEVVQNDKTGAVAQFNTSTWDQGYYDVDLIARDGFDYYSWAGQIQKQ